MTATAKPAKSALLGRYVVSRIPWDEQAAAWSALLPHDRPELHGDHLGALVKSGKASAYELRGPAGRMAILVASISTRYAEPELNIVAAYCAENMGDLTAEFLPQLEEQARAAGCATVRFHTMRPGLIAKAQAHGFRACEVIMRKDLR